jgi:hypothetical protein
LSQYLPERLDARGINLASRVAVSNTVAASPALAAETTICTLTIPANLQVFQSVILEGQAAWTQGTSATAYTLKLRQTDTSGTTLYSSGLIPAAAALLVNAGVMGLDASPSAGQVYVMTLTVAAGAATSTVSAATLTATIV